MLHVRKDVCTLNWRGRSGQDYRLDAQCFHVSEWVGGLSADSNHIFDRSSSKILCGLIYLALVRAEKEANKIDKLVKPLKCICPFSCLSFSSFDLLPNPEGFYRQFWNMPWANSSGKTPIWKRSGFEAFQSQGNINMCLVFFQIQALDQTSISFLAELSSTINSWDMPWG